MGSNSQKGSVLARLFGRPDNAHVAVGDPAPAFRMQDQNGEWHTPERHRGHWVVLYFYPKDDTPGCTKEACSFRDNVGGLRDLGAIVLGVSTDDVGSHDRFAKKFGLPFPILADTDGSTAQSYGVLGGLGPLRFATRQTFIIDPAGRIAKHYAKVKAAEHPEEVLADLKSLRA